MFSIWRFFTDIWLAVIEELHKNSNVTPLLLGSRSAEEKEEEDEYGDAFEKDQVKSFESFNEFTLLNFKEFETSALDAIENASVEDLEFDDDFEAILLSLRECLFKAPSKSYFSLPIDSFGEILEERSLEFLIISVPLMMLSYVMFQTYRRKPQETLELSIDLEDESTESLYDVYDGQVFLDLNNKSSSYFLDRTIDDSYYSVDSDTLDYVLSTSHYPSKSSESSPSLASLPSVLHSSRSSELFEDPQSSPLNLSYLSDELEATKISQGESEMNSTITNVDNFVDFEPLYLADDEELEQTDNQLNLKDFYPVTYYRRGRVLGKDVNSESAELSFIGSTDNTRYESSSFTPSLYRIKEADDREDVNSVHNSLDELENSKNYDSILPKSSPPIHCKIPENNTKLGSHPLDMSPINFTSTHDIKLDESIIDESFDLEKNLTDSLIKLTDSIDENNEAKSKPISDPEEKDQSPSSHFLKEPLSEICDGEEKGRSTPPFVLLEPLSELHADQFTPPNNKLTENITSEVILRDEASTGEPTQAQPALDKSLNAELKENAAVDDKSSNLPRKESILRVIYDGNNNTNSPSKIPVIFPGRKTFCKASAVALGMESLASASISDAVLRFFFSGEENAEYIEDYLTYMFGDDPTIDVNSAFLKSLNTGHIDVIMKAFEGPETSLNWQERYNSLDIIIGHLRTHLPEDHYSYFEEKLYERMEDILLMVNTKRSKLLSKVIITLRDIVYYGDSITNEFFVSLLHILIPLTRLSQTVRYISAIAQKSLCIMIQSIDIGSFIKNFELMFENILRDKLLKAEKYSCLFLIKFYIVNNAQNLTSDELIRITAKLVPFIPSLSIDRYQNTRAEVVEIYLIIEKLGSSSKELTDYYFGLSSFHRSKIRRVHNKPD